MVATKRGVGFSREAWPEEESNVDGNGRDVVSECNSILSDVRSVYDQLESSLAALEERVRVTNGGLQGFSEFSGMNGIDDHESHMGGSEFRRMYSQLNEYPWFNPYVAQFRRGRSADLQSFHER
ncbi:hypothetical protein GUITHDRAFT_152274 [Guillardia theta CCMP2712]|uniref:Uncharacterized protein n=1 Tax=Guillardia theta (strain CCMP2712) TaxID=905079 RepID=L1JER4_GUITC|nr:hypothetical protein GUITHDRAFT_152274 [Guillardia theta CCMP2712]EKX46600.1 hypothetical protein GUITHDRAFT_152274 [Guillardia theta CCMP2712]|eukprot:XP_005833580.1 hypothetical protein GUITHDRAFT_152274 [Guillardia theta CCMP2712]